LKKGENFDITLANQKILYRGIMVFKKERDILQVWSHKGRRGGVSHDGTGGGKEKSKRRRRRTQGKQEEAKKPMSQWIFCHSARLTICSFCKTGPNYLQEKKVFSWL